MIPVIAERLMRSVSILELCLLGFLCLSMNALRLSVRDMAFGIALGFGLMSANDFIFAAFWSPRHTSLNAPLQFVYEAAILFSLGIWVAYCALPEPGAQARRDAGELDHLPLERDRFRAGPHRNPGCCSQPANGFFLTDVENVVEKVLNRNLKGRESES